jgi:hypothetical protein
MIHIQLQYPSHNHPPSRSFRHSQIGCFVSARICGACIGQTRCGQTLVQCNGGCIHSPWSESPSYHNKLVMNTDKKKKTYMRTWTSPPVSLIDILESAFVTQLEACWGTVMLAWTERIQEPFWESTFIIQFNMGVRTYQIIKINGL